MGAKNTNQASPRGNDLPDDSDGLQIPPAIVGFGENARMAVIVIYMQVI